MTFFLLVIIIIIVLFLLDRHLGNRFTLIRFNTNIYDIISPLGIALIVIALLCPQLVQYIVSCFSSFDLSVLLLIGNDSLMLHLGTLVILHLGILFMCIFSLFRSHDRSKVLLRPIVVPFAANCNDPAITLDAYRFLKARINEGMTTADIEEAAYGLYNWVIRPEDIAKVTNILITKGEYHPPILDIFVPSSSSNLSTVDIPLADPILIPSVSDPVTTPAQHTVTASSLTSDDTLNLVPDLASDAIQLQPWFPLVVTIGFTILFLALAEIKLHYSNTQASTISAPQLETSTFTPTEQALEHGNRVNYSIYEPLSWMSLWLSLTLIGIVFYLFLYHYIVFFKSANLQRFNAC
jgi:hypothetical protein